jgi:hypothetical protein
VGKRGRDTTFQGCRPRDLFLGSTNTCFSRNQIPATTGDPMHQTKRLTLVVCHRPAWRECSRRSNAPRWCHTPALPPSVPGFGRQSLASPVSCQKASDPPDSQIDSPEHADGLRGVSALEPTSLAPQNRDHATHGLAVRVRIIGQFRLAGAHEREPVVPKVPDGPLDSHGIPRHAVVLLADH